MNKSKILFLPFLVCLFSCQEETIHCLISTELGEIAVELYPERAPITVENFLAYVEHGAYTGSSFFRVCTPENEADREIKIEVIQGGNIPEEFELPPITLETTEMTGLSHTDGVLSMARAEPNSAQSNFFICIGDQPELDFGGKRNPDGQGFAAFGKVTSGMEVVRDIQRQKEVGQYLVDSVRIGRIVVRGED
ncbi:peptidylprolyl isomerase [Lunatibacter salilacus]|uniref:peptidylprolyl isomerase n=1 Tax=Lunatibacter salilacus TaxID=2483804 RepID=UPI00131B6D5D|nr:peptidylprolyl isomerase [Lunatibacter salilacus]